MMRHKIGSFFARVAARLRPGPTDVLVLHVPGGKDAERAVRDGLREIGVWPKLANGALVLVLPPDVTATVEPRLKPAEDLGYGKGNRETANVAVDADAAAESKRAICGATPTR